MPRIPYAGGLYDEILSRTGEEIRLSDKPFRSTRLFNINGRRDIIKAFRVFLENDRIGSLKITTYIVGEVDGNGGTERISFLGYSGTIPGFNGIIEMFATENPHRGSNLSKEERHPALPNTPENPLYRHDSYTSIRLADYERNGAVRNRTTRK